MYFFRLLYQYLEEHYFSSSLNSSYENLPYTKTTTTLLMLVGGLALGVLIASFVAVYQKKVVGKFIRGLLAAMASTPESAKSLAELGLEKSGAVKNELSRLSVSRKLIATVHADGSVTTYRDELAEAFPEKTDTHEVNAEEKPEQTGERRGRVREFFTFKSFKPRALDFASCRFFIPEELSARAALRFAEKGSSVKFLILAVALVVVLFFAALALIPFFVQMLDATIGNLKGL